MGISTALTRSSRTIRSLRRWIACTDALEGLEIDHLPVGEDVVDQQHAAGLEKLKDGLVVVRIRLLVRVEEREVECPGRAL